MDVKSRSKRYEKLAFLGEGQVLLDTVAHSSKALDSLSHSFHSIARHTSNQRFNKPI